MVDERIVQYVVQFPVYFFTNSQNSRFCKWFSSYNDLIKWNLTCVISNWQQLLPCAISCTTDLTVNGEKHPTIFSYWPHSLTYLSLVLPLILISWFKTLASAICWISGIIQDRGVVFVMTLISINSLKGREKSKVPFKVLSLLRAMFVSDEMCHTSCVQHCLSNMSCHITSSIMCHIM